jgi:hypothetical protein
MGGILALYNCLEKHKLARLGGPDLGGRIC